MLLIAVATTVICAIWIALDSGTEDVFIVYGRMFRTAWQMRAWSAFVSCGWRFGLIVGAILVNVSLAYQATIRNRIDADTATIAPWCLAVLLAAGLVPWTFLMRVLHQRRTTNADAKRLTDMANRLCTAPDLSSELERADYSTESGWDAWHPHTRFFESSEGRKLWGRVAPVVYTSTESPRTVVIPLDWEYFCVWGRPPAFAESNKLLPFGGPGVSRFRVGSSVRQLKAVGDCWIVQAELELPEDDEDRPEKELQVIRQ